MRKYSAQTVKCVKTVVFISSIGIVSGCNSLQIHSSRLEAASTSVKTDWDAIELSTTIDSERQNLNKLLEAEQSAIERRFDAKLQISIDLLLFDKDFQSTYEALFSEQVERLVGEEVSFETFDFEEFGNNITSIEGERSIGLENLADANEIIAQIAPDLGEITCAAVQKKESIDKITEDISKLSASDSAGATASISRISDNCEKIVVLDEKFKKHLGNVGGRLEQSIDLNNSLIQSIDEIKLNARLLNNKYKKQLKEYDDLTKKSKSVSNKLKLQKLSANLKKTIDDLNAIPGGFGEKIIAESRIEKLDDAIRIIAGETNNNANASQSLKEGLAQLSLISSLKDDIDIAIADSKKPLATPLLISREHHKLKYAAASARVKSEEAKLGLANQLVDVLLAQVEVLLNSSRSYAIFQNQARQQNLNMNAPTVQVITEAKQNRKQDINTRFELYSAIVHLMDAIGRVDLQSYQIEQDIIANAHESALSQGDIAVKMWENLISQSISQLAQYYSGGMKSEQIAEYLQALGIVWIGNGVN